MQTDVVQDADWFHRALSYFSEGIQGTLVMKTIEADNLRRDVLAQLKAAERLTGMGFSILDGNGAEGVFRAQYDSDEVIWVVSCSLSRYVTHHTEPQSHDEILKRLHFAKHRALKDCLKKVPGSERVTIFLNVDPNMGEFDATELDSLLFDRGNGQALIAGKEGKRITSALVSYGDPEEDLTWVLHRPNSVN